MKEFDNIETAKVINRSIERVNWIIRDEEILIQTQNTVSKILKQNKFVSITVVRIGANLGLKVLLKKHLDKLPQIIAI